MSSLSEFIELYELSTDRRVIALQRTLAAARLRGDVDLVEHIDDALDGAMATRELESEWQESRSRRSGMRAVSIDRRIDALLARLYAVLEGFSGLGNDVGERAAAFQRRLFPAGLSGHVHRPHGEQLHQNDRVIDDLKDEVHGATVAEFRLAPFSSRLDDLNEQFRDVLVDAAEETVSFAAVRMARARDHEVLLQVVARILGRFPTQSEQDIAARDSLLSAIRDQHQDARQGWSEPFQSVSHQLDPADAAAIGEE